MGCVMADGTQSPRRRRPGGRTARTRALALRAVLDELVERGYRHLTVEGVAARAGVHKTTLYRRWGSIDALLADAATQAMDQAVPIPDTGTLEEDLVQLASLIAANLRRPLTQALVRAVAAEADRGRRLRDVSAAFWWHRAELTRELVDRAVSRGELSIGTDPAALLEALVAPIYLRLLVTGRPIDAVTVRAAANVAALAGRHGQLIVAA